MKENEIDEFSGFRRMRKVVREMGQVQIEGAGSNSNYKKNIQSKGGQICKLDHTCRVHTNYSENIQPALVSSEDQVDLKYLLLTEQFFILGDDTCNRNYIYSSLCS